MSSYTSDRLEIIDEYFKNKSEIEKWIMIIFFAGSIALIVYSYFLPYAKSLYSQSMLEHDKISTNIHKKIAYLSSISNPKVLEGDRDYKVKQYDRSIADKKKSIKSYKKRIAVINSNLNELSGLLFNQKNWSLLLNSLTDRASINGIVINRLANHYVDNNNSFGHVLEIGLNCEGSFGDIINFISDIEQNTLITDIYSSKIYKDVNQSTILADINISVWGVNH